MEARGRLPLGAVAVRGVGAEVAPSKPPEENPLKDERWRERSLLSAGNLPAAAWVRDVVCEELTGRVLPRRELPRPQGQKDASFEGRGDAVAACRRALESRWRAQGCGLARFCRPDTAFR